MPFDGLGSANASTIQAREVSSLFSERLWERSAQKKLTELAQLPEDWNSYGSKPILPRVIQKAAKLLSEFVQLEMPEPEIFPVAGGGIQMEWHHSDRDLEIEILPDLSIEVLFSDDENTTELRLLEISDLREVEILSYFNYLLRSKQDVCDPPPSAVK